MAIYLFVCNSNNARSPTAVDVCIELAERKGLRIVAKSAGLVDGIENRLTQEGADEADKIFVMEKHMVGVVQEKYHQPQGKIVCLGIPDMYTKDDSFLRELLYQKLNPYID